MYNQRTVKVLMRALQLRLAMQIQILVEVIKKEIQFLQLRRMLLPNIIWKEMKSVPTTFQSIIKNAW